MDSIPQHQIERSLKVPRFATALCLGIAMLAPYAGSIADIPYGQWNPLFSKLSPDLGAVGLTMGYLLVASMVCASVGPTVYAASALQHTPLAFWLSLAAYLAAALMGHGTLNRVLGGDGLESVAVLMLVALAAFIGTTVGLVLSRIVTSQAAQHTLVAVALSAAVVGAMTWNTFDAAAFPAEKRRWQERYHPSSTRPLPPLPCLGYANADSTLRLFVESDCTSVLQGRHVSNGECLKYEGGSFSWDLRDMNQRCR